MAFNGAASLADDEEKFDDGDRKGGGGGERGCQRQRLAQEPVDEKSSHQGLDRRQSQSKERKKDQRRVSARKDSQRLFFCRRRGEERERNPGEHKDFGTRPEAAHRADGEGEPHPPS